NRIVGRELSFTEDFVVIPTIDLEIQLFVGKVMTIYLYVSFKFENQIWTLKYVGILKHLNHNIHIRNELIRFLDVFFNKIHRRRRITIRSLPKSIF
ncbi:hypothetical protein, partial [Leptospira interrogans]|uniref:hypothetical protein n=1 Tax=Leptospira interrogans TaxID=173 RepID=UPI00215FE6A3